MNFTTRAWMLHLHERMLPINLLLVGKWKDLHEATSLQRICTYHLVGFLWPLNVLYPPQGYGSCTSVRKGSSSRVRLSKQRSPNRFLLEEGAAVLVALGLDLLGDCTSFGLSQFI